MSSNFVDWCGEVLESDNYVILDTETTGLGSLDQVIELAIIDASCFVLSSELLRPSCPIGEAAMAVHHITEEMVRTARSFSEAWPQVERAIGGRKIITWNAAFDARMLVQTGLAHGITLRTMDFYCAMKEYQRYYHFAKWQKLTNACQQQGIDFVENHRALGDAMAVLEIKSEPLPGRHGLLSIVARLGASLIAGRARQRWQGFRAAMWCRWSCRTGMR